MSAGVRLALFGAAAAVLAAFAVWGLSGLPGYGRYPGPYGTTLNALAPRERHIPNVITAVNFDYRGFDTLIEENILFAAVAGVTLVFRSDRARTTRRPLPPARGRARVERTDAVRLFALAAYALTIAFGAYVALHPHLTPGGGFQGGAILSGAAALAFLGLGFPAFEKLVRQEPLEAFEAVGAGGYTAVGCAALAVAGSFLANVLPLGTTGDLYSTGTIPLVNAFVAIEVIAGFAVLFLEFARETRIEGAEER